MQLQLQVVQGILQHRDGGTAGAKILIPPGRRFVIGTAPDCQMRCAGNSIDPQHCEIFVDRDRVILRDRGSRQGTLVNGIPVDGTACLFHGDRLQIGRLQFEVCLVATQPTGPPKLAPLSPPLSPPLPSSTHDTVRDVRETIANDVAEMLMVADSEDRQRRRFDPASREFRPEPPPPPEPASPSLRKPPGETKLPAKKPPAKLPAPPPIRGNDSVDSANQALLQIFTPTKKKS